MTYLTLILTYLRFQLANNGIHLTYLCSVIGYLLAQLHLVVLALGDVLAKGLDLLQVEVVLALQLSILRHKLVVAGLD